jgi:hypothetical protein
LMTLPDGQGGTQPMFVRVWEDTGLASSTTQGAPLLAAFGLIETSDGTQSLGALLFQDGDASAGLLTTFDPPATLSLDEVARDAPGTTFTPALVSVSLSTQEESLLVGTPIPLDHSSLPITSEPAPSGQYGLITSVTDVFGNASSDIQTANITTPIAP